MKDFLKEVTSKLRSKRWEAIKTDQELRKVEGIAYAQAQSRHDGWAVSVKTKWITPWEVVEGSLSRYTEKKSLKAQGSKTDLVCLGICGCLGTIIKNIKIIVYVLIAFKVIH